MKRTLCFLAILCCIAFQIKAQTGIDEQTYKPCILQISENGKTKTFAIESFSYSISRSRDESGIPANDKQTVYLNFSLNDIADNGVIEWIAQPGSSKNGKIIFRDKNTGQNIKEFSFEGAYVESSNESFYSSYLESYASSLSLNISCSKFSINNIPVKNIASPGN